MPEQAKGQDIITDRAYVAMNFFEANVMDLEVVETDPEVKAAAEELHQKLYDFYQLCGAKFI